MVSYDQSLNFLINTSSLGISRIICELLHEMKVKFNPIHLLHISNHKKKNVLICGIWSLLVNCNPRYNVLALTSMNLKLILYLFIGQLLLY